MFADCANCCYLRKIDRGKRNMSVEMNFDKKHQTFAVSVLFLDDSTRVFSVEVNLVCVFLHESWI